MDIFDDDYPYLEGTLISLFSHEPQTYAQASAQEITEEEDHLNASGRCNESVFRFPAFQPPEASSRAPTEQIEVTEILAGGLGRQAQVVLCRRLASSNRQPIPEYCVAKILDPLFYGSSRSLNLAANCDYACEADAYRRIEANKNTQPGLCTPRFLGTRCFELTEPGSGNYEGASLSQSVARPGRQVAPRTRTVCLVLVEHVQGSTLRSLALTINGGVSSQSYVRYGEPYRLYVWARLLEAQAWLESIGLDQGDLKPDNVIVDPPPIPDNARKNSRMKPRIVLFDFGQSELLHNDEHDKERRRKQELPRSPITTWWHGYHWKLGEWCPAWWHIDFPRRREWLKEEFGSRGIAARYQKVENLGDPSLLTEEDKHYINFYNENILGRH